MPLPKYGLFPGQLAIQPKPWPASILNPTFDWLIQPPRPPPHAAFAAPPFRALFTTASSRATGTMCVLNISKICFFLAFAEKTIAAISVVSTVLLSTAYPFGKYDKLSDISYITHSDSWQQSHTCHIQFSYTLKFLVGFSATREPLSVSVFLCGPVYDSCVRCSFRSIHILTHSTK